MARQATESMDDLVRSAMEGVVKRASSAIARVVAELAASRLDAELSAQVARAARHGGGRGPKVQARRPARVEMTRWAADRRARRVPNFVIAMTGLKTKKQIVARYGEGATFEKGKPAPKSK